MGRFDIAKGIKLVEGLPPKRGPEWAYSEAYKMYYLKSASEWAKRFKEKNEKCRLRSNHES